jgi:ATP synthase protein I
MTGSTTGGSDGAPDGGDGGSRRAEPSAIPSEVELADRLKALSARLDAKPTVNEAVERMRAREKDATGMAKALRLSSEFIAGVVVGGALGWFIDRLAGTTPFGLIVFLLLGFGAGVLNVMRVAGVVAEPAYRKADPPKGSNGASGEGDQDPRG